MAIFEKEDKPEKEGEEELPHRRARAQISSNMLGKALAGAVIIAILAMILLYFWPQLVQ